MPGRFFSDNSCISLWLRRLKGGNLSLVPSEDARAKSESPLNVYPWRWRDVSSIEGVTTRCWNLLDALYNSPSSGRWCLKHKFHRFDLADPLYITNHTHIDNTFSSIEGGTTPKLKNAQSILTPVYRHTHRDNTFSSIEGGTTPKLKNAPSILSPVYHHRDNIFRCRGGYYPETEKCAVYPNPCLPSYS